MSILPYTSVSISGYNSSPPPDDGSQTTANKVTWAYHKNKIGDPIKTLAESINTNVLSAVNSLALEDWSALTTSATVAESDWHNGFIKTATGGKLNLPSPSSLEDGWHVLAFNAATEDWNIQATATDAFRNRYGSFASEIFLPPGKGIKLYTTATVWLAAGLSHQVDDVDAMVAVQMFA